VFLLSATGKGRSIVVRQLSFVAILQH
jgi:hypothetical protein